MNHIFKVNIWKPGVVIDTLLALNIWIMKNQDLYLDFKSSSKMKAGCTVSEA